MCLGMLWALVAGGWWGSGWCADKGIYRAGSLVGKSLYWQPQEELELDTLGWDQWGSDAVVVGQADTTVGALVGRLGQNQLQVVQLRQCSAIVAALVSQMHNYSLVVLTQWHGSTKGLVKVPLPGMVNQAVQHNIVSDYLWERPSAIKITDAGSVGQSDYGVELLFGPFGSAQFGAREQVVLQDRAMSGVHGFSVAVPEVEFYEDVFMQRTILAVYLVAPADKRTKDIVADIEKMMDRKKLDLSYKVPEIRALR
jgi:hypothetical protein